MLKEDKKKLSLFDRGQTRGGGVSVLMVIVLRSFLLLCAPKLFVWLKEAPKHVFYSLQTPYITPFQIYLTLQISPHICQNLSDW